MRSFNKLMAVILALMLVIFLSVDYVLLHHDKTESGYYLVEVNRVKHEIDDGSEIDIGKYKTIKGVYRYDSADDEAFKSGSQYVMYKTDGGFYRIEYSIEDKTSFMRLFKTVNIGFAVIAVAVLALLLYLKNRMIRPFNKISRLPIELSKGNLTEPLKEERSRYFGKFVWGLDLLREKLEASKQKELEHAKAEKTMILSLSHDIKTPLSAIKLYSRALSKGIYKDSDKINEVYKNIGERADEIENYLSEIIKHSTDDFMSFEVSNRDFYLNEVIESIESFYREKLSQSGTEFQVGSYINCLINGDPDRLIEVIQNLMENAIKYGDGKSIAVSFSDEENCRLITVTNSGCTLSENEQDHIFDSFWRGSNTDGKSGSGLGLYICRRLMHEMNGDIFAEAKDGVMSVTAVCRKSE